jgi:hypothetical protein
VRLSAGAILLAWLMTACSAREALPRSELGAFRLAFHECRLTKTSGGPEWGGPCLQWLRPDDGSVMARFGELADDHGNFALSIGQRRFYTTSNELTGLPSPVQGPDIAYTLYEDGRSIASLSGRVTGHLPSIGLMNLGGRAAWELDDGALATVIYDGRDLREAFGLDRVWQPHLVQGKLIFIGEKAQRSFLVYDGHRVGPDFDHVYVYHCCEAAMTASIRMGEDSYGFLADRDGQPVAVVVTSADEAPVTPGSR